MTIKLALSGARNRDFQPNLEVDYIGAELPLSGAFISMQVRQYPGQSGLPIASDQDCTYSDAVHSTTVGMRTLTVQPLLSRSVLASAPTGLNEPEFGEADQFVYEITLTYSDGEQDTLFTGQFHLEPGVDDT